MSDIDKDSLESSSDPKVQQYSQILRGEYINQDVVAADYPPRYGCDFFGRLKLLDIQDRYIRAEKASHKAFYLLRGKIDKISDFDRSKSITVEDVLKPNNDQHPLRVVVDGPPGIGKTTLCRKILNMWAKGEIKYQGYDLALYCPLRNDRVASAESLADFFIINSRKVTSVVEWLEERDGEGLLIIFDGWDELSEQHKKESLAAKIICREDFVKSSVIVTSRTYASASLLEAPSVDRHVEVVGFSENEVKEVIKETLSEETHQAQKLIEHLEVRGDALSLCYIPLICSIVISVCRNKEQFPITLTELYKDFIIETFKRHVKIKVALKVEPSEIHSLEDLPEVIDKPLMEMSHLAYLGLTEDSPKMTFTILQPKKLHLEEASKMQYLGLMNTYSMYEKVNYQFLHLTVQEFLAAWWIARNDIEEEAFKNYHNNDHLKMCLRFVAGLTHLENMHNQIFRIIDDQFFEPEEDLKSETIHDKGSETFIEQDLKDMKGLVLQNHETFSELNEQLEIEEGFSCIKIPYFGFYTRYISRYQFYQNQKIFNNHHQLVHNLSRTIFTFQLLYEAQNVSYCQDYAQYQFEIPSLCLYGQNLSPFDMLCVSYFLQNSNKAWNHLHISDPNNVKIFADSLINSSQQNSSCNILDIAIDLGSTQTKFLSSSFLCNITECYCVCTCPGFDSYDDKPLNSVSLFMELINLSKLKVLYFEVKELSSLEHEASENCFKIQSSLQKNIILEEMSLTMEKISATSKEYVKSVIKGLAMNTKVESCRIGTIHTGCAVYNLSEEVKCLLKENCTLKALRLLLPSICLCPRSIPSAIEVNTPLNSFSIDQSMMADLIIQNCKSLQFLECNPLECSVPKLFQCHPCLQQLQLILNTTDSVIELFTILKHNNTMTALQIKIENSKDILADDNVGISLQDMIKENRKIQYLELDLVSEPNYIPNTYLPYLIAGLEHNSTLQGFDTPLPLSKTCTELITNFFEVISNRQTLTELNLDLFRDQCDNQSTDEETAHTSDRQPSEEELTKLYISLLLPLIINLLKKNIRMKLFQIRFCSFEKKISEKEETPTALELMWTACFHPSLKYFGAPSLLSNDEEKKVILEAIHTRGTRVPSVDTF